jgi:hypothetical protein
MSVKVLSRVYTSATVAGNEYVGTPSTDAHGIKLYTFTGVDPSDAQALQAAFGSNVWTGFKVSA